MATNEEARRAPTNGTSEEALRRHALSRGKVRILPRCAIRGFEGLAVRYTPDVAARCRAIRAEPDRVYESTDRGNCIAVVSDGTRVLGLGDLGPEAGLPVVEGKALLFKYLGGVDAVPLCLGTKDPADLVRTVGLLAPSFGGINPEDIAQPECLRALEDLRRDLETACPAAGGRTSPTRRWSGPPTGPAATTRPSAGSPGRASPETSATPS